MDDGIKDLAEMAVDLARRWELTNDEEDELLALVAAAYRAGCESERGPWVSLATEFPPKVRLQ